MDLAPLLISEEEAAERLREYEEQIVTERTAEDEAIRMGYRAAKRGLPVFSLRNAFEVAGRFPPRGRATIGLPRLAIIRADAIECFVHSSGRDLIFSDRQWERNRGALVGKDTVRLVDGAVGEDGRGEWIQSAKTIVPIIPPRHRPNRRRIRGFHIIWEVEEWSPTPPKDPALVRHIRGDLWSVAAVWDLSELERRVLFGRA